METSKIEPGKIDNAQIYDTPIQIMFIVPILVRKPSNQDARRTRPLALLAKTSLGPESDVELTPRRSRATLRPLFKMRRSENANIGKSPYENTEKRNSYLPPVPISHLLGHLGWS